MVTLCVSRPYPDMSDLLRFMREQFGFIRVIVVSMERCRDFIEISGCMTRCRSPKELVKTLMADKISSRYDNRMETR